MAEPESRGGNGERDNSGKRDAEDVEQHMRMPAPLIYETVRRDGEAEMDRPITSLWWSGFAAGMSISFSLLTQAILEVHLPETAWRPLVTSLGYSVGFLIVVLARQQLFTENTITAVLPLLAEPSSDRLARLGRLWGIVFAANLAGTLCSAVLYIHARAHARTSRRHAGNQRPNDGKWLDRNVL